MDTRFSGGLGQRFAGGQWRVDAMHNEIIAVTNGGTKATDALLTLHYENGEKKYEMRQSIPAGGQIWVNVADLIHNRIADRNGNVLPADLASGTYEMQDLNPQPGSLLNGSLSVDNTSSHGPIPQLATCCSTSVSFSPSIFDLTPDPVWAPIVANSYDQCTGEQSVFTQDIFSWWPGNSAIAQVQPAEVEGVSAGVTFVEGESDPVYVGYGTNCVLKNLFPKATVTVVAAVVSQRTSGAVSTDDAALSAYKTAEGTTNLGAIIGTGTPVQGCFIGNEAVGTITPSTYSGTLTLHRWILADAYYSGQSPMAGGVTNQDDTSQPALRDDNPQSGGSAGKIYDLDAPGISINQADGVTYRYRGNFYAYATLPDGTKISPYYNYYVRVSCKKTASGYQFDNTLPGDNSIAAGTTITSWDFQ